MFFVGSKNTQLAFMIFIEVLCWHRLLQDSSIQKGASKRQKRDEKITHYAVHISPSIYLF